MVPITYTNDSYRGLYHLFRRISIEIVASIFFTHTATLFYNNPYIFYGVIGTILDRSICLRIVNT